MKNQSNETINEVDKQDYSAKEGERMNGHQKDEQNSEDQQQQQQKSSDSDSANKRKVSIAVPVSYEPRDGDTPEPKERIIQITKEADRRWDEQDERQETYHEQSHRKSLERANLAVRKRECRSTSPHQRRRSTLADLGLLSGGHQTNSPTSHQQLLRIQPAIPANANIRNILENVSRSGK